MSCFWKHMNETFLQIPSAKEVENITFYLITVCIDDVTWAVSRRYSEFYDLHQILCNDHGVSKTLLPPKRTIRNKCPNFIESRRQALETYLQNIFNYLKRTMPRVFIEFLEFNVYDTFYLLKRLAFQFYSESDGLLNSTQPFYFTPLELYSLNVWLKEPYPNIVDVDKRYDFSHVLDFCTQLKHLTITGNPKKFLLSNIEPNKLPIDLSTFKNLRTLLVQTMPLDNITNLGNLRATLERFTVSKSAIVTVSQVLQCDVIHKLQISEVHVWNKIEYLNLSSNNIQKICSSINLARSVRTLVLNQNKIEELGDLSGLTQLTHLYLTDNLIHECEDMHTKLGNVIVLDLSQNSISRLNGFRKLYSLENLNLSSNKICDITEIANIGKLPCIENLVLTGNVVATVVDYRAKVFEYFSSRAKEICLDNEKPTQSELDKAALFQALTIVREGKTPQLK